jgi:hypothetical protein
MMPGECRDVLNNFPKIYESGGGQPEERLQEKALDEVDP